MSEAGRQSRCDREFTELGREQQVLPVKSAVLGEG